VQHQATHARKDASEANSVSPLLRHITTAWRSLPGLGGIGLRLLVRVLLFSSVITLLLTLMQLYLDYRRDVGAIDERMSEIDSGYRRSLGEGLWRLDARQLQLQVEGILHLPDIRYVELREATDRAAPLVVTAGSRQANPPQRREFRIYYTTSGAEQLVGILVVEATFDRIYHQLFDTAAVILVGQAIKTFIVSFFILLIVHRLITRHLTAIATSLKGYDLQGSHAPLRLERHPPRSADELDRLIEAFSQMYARLQAGYGDLQEREAKIRRLVDSNIMGIFIWDFQGRFLEVNDEFIRMVGYDREELLGGSIRWTDLTPPDWRDRNNRRIEQQKSSGRFEPFEKEYIRKDGSRVPVLIGGATFEEGGNQGVAFVLDLTERKRADQALIRSEAYLAEAQKLTHTGIWTWDPRTEKVLYCSDVMFQIFGLDPRESLPSRESFRQQIHPEDRGWVKKRFEESLRERVDTYAEYRVLLSDGTVRHINASGHPVLNEDGELIEFVGTAVDVTERKRAEESLRESEAKFRDYAESASDWYWETDPDHKFVRVTDYERLRARGFTPVSRAGLARWEFATDVESEPEKWRLHRSMLDARQPFRDFVYRATRSGGSPVYYKISGKPIYDAKGAFLGYRGTGTDVTERKLAEVAGQQLAAIVDSSEDAIVSKDLNGTIESWNDGAERLFGYQASEVIGKSILIIIPPDRHDEERRILECIRRGERIKSYETVRMHEDGRLLDISLTVSPLRDAAGRIIGASKIARDITERKRAEETLRATRMELAHANRVATMGQLSASITHEVKQPIGAARNNARAALNFLGKDPPDLDEVREALSCVVGDADRAGDIVDRIRALVKKAPPRKERLDINAGIREVIELTRDESAKNGISIQVDLADGLPLIEGDRVQLQQVILNLIVNAVEAMSGAGDGTRELLISSRNEPDAVLVGVRDSGPGLAPETLDHVFDAFYTTKPGGLGMGLSICRSIIEAHGGRLWASADLPRGASFEFALPVIANPAS
jgi:PAS domain S-box-containing protein